MGNKISTYTNTVDKLAPDTGQFDVSDPTGALESKRHLFQYFKGVNLLASAIGVDTSTAAVTAMTLNFSDKEVFPTHLIVINTATGKGLPNIEVRINKDSGTGDIMKTERLSGMVADGTYIFPISGYIPQLLDSHVQNLEVVTASTAATTCDFFTLGFHRSV